MAERKITDSQQTESLDSIFVNDGGNLRQIPKEKAREALGITDAESNIDDLKSDISDIGDIAVINGATANLYNPLVNLDPTMTIVGGQVYTRTSDSMQGAAIIPIKQGLFYQLIDFDAQGNASVTPNNWRIITNDGTLIRYADGQQPFVVSYQASHSAETTAILQINLRTSAVKTMIVEFYHPQNSLYTSTYVPPVNAMNSCKDWNGKVWCTYGDSFVAQGNGDLLTNGWQKYVNDYMGFAKHFGRGIGGTSFLYGSKSYYLDGHGVYDTSYTSGTLVHGGFCAWDRITNQIPDKVRNDIELLFVLGGNNDYTNYYNPDNTSWKEWSASNTDDADWISYCTSHGLPVGDYQIGGNPKGAIMSMIMKLQIWCPNAIIVICGGAPTRGDVSGQNMTKPSEKTVAELTHNMRDIRDMVKDVADWCSIPYVDIYSDMGVNFLNRNIYSDDTIHPNTNGQKMLARSICGALKNILPKDIFDN